jgi:diguanylate cyclase (GGDEF)-like protein/PAS domain S-box-containing protein
MSNIKKDNEIKKIYKELDELVYYSKTDIDGNIIYVSGAFEKISGYTKDELLNQNHRIIKHEDMKREFFVDLWNTILDKKVFSGEIKNKAKDGSSYWVKVTIIPELDEKDNIIAFSAYRVIITDKKMLESKTNELIIVNKKLEELSVVDPLTQIYNRIKLDSVLQELYNSYKRYNNVFSLIIIDIDYFKDVNDAHGHLVGDKTLKSVVKIIKNIIREVDIFGRWGGEEFMIISQDTDCEGAYILAQKIRSVIESFEFEMVGKKTVSLGVSQIDEKTSILELIKKADDALYIAKSRGRNRVVKYKEI